MPTTVKPSHPWTRGARLALDLAARIARLHRYCPVCGDELPRHAHARNCEACGRWARALYLGHVTRREAQTYGDLEIS